MKRFLTLLTVLVTLISCFVLAAGTPQKRRKANVGTNANVRRNKAQSNNTTTLRNGQRGRYVTRNGKRIWVPQGSPARGNTNSVFEKDQIPIENKSRNTNRGVFEREQILDVKKSTTNTNRP